MKLKIWWKGEPLIVGSLRYRIIENDLLQAMQAACREWKKLYP